MRSRPAQMVTVLYVLVGCWYLWWRTFHTVNTDALPLSLPLLAADYLGFGFFLLFAANLWARTSREPAPPEAGVSVDVLIPTYNEPLSVLRPTIAAALAMEYPHTTYVLDDGRRENVRALCDEMGALYLTRPDNKGAKAGNINAALPRTSGELIAIFDADHAPFANFLTEMLGYFRDPSVALAQAPQAYYNLDSFQHAAGRRSRHGVPWHEQSVFYDAIMPGKDRWNAAFWCGSTAIIRRAALAQVGGVDTRTVTEDMHTAMRIHAAGWKSVYHDRELALGIAPDDVAAFLVQRLRWAQGALQILRNDNPLLCRGLTVRQRFAYFTSVAYVFEYIPKLVYLVTPAMALLVGVLPMENMGWNLLYRFAPYWALGVIASMMLTGGTNPYMQAERFHMLKLWVMLRALWGFVWPRKLKFVVTPKAGDGRDHRMEDLRLLRMQMALAALSLAAVVWAAAAVFARAPWKLSGASLALTTGWALFNAGVLFSVIRTVLRRHHRRKLFRFAVDAPLTVTIARRAAVGRVEDISAVGLGGLTPVAVTPGDTVVVKVPVGPGASIVASLRVTGCRPEGDRFRFGGEFENMGAGAERQLVLFLYQRVAPQSLHNQDDNAHGGSITPFRHREALARKAS